jgi:hypothetical protein
MVDSYISADRTGSVRLLNKCLRRNDAEAQFGRLPPRSGQVSFSPNEYALTAQQAIFDRFGAVAYKLI